MELVQQRVTRMTGGLDTKLPEESLKDLGIFSLDRRRLRGDMIVLFRYMKGCHSKEGRKLFLLKAEDRNHNNGF